MKTESAKRKLMKMNAAVLVVVILLSTAALTAEGGGCTEEVTSFSACLEYVSNPPNNLTENATEKCCNAFWSGVDSLCLCHLIKEPLMLGFPLNTTRILSLSSLCPSQTSPSTSLSFLCSVSPSLPPLNGESVTTDKVIGGRVPSATPGRVIGGRVPSAPAGNVIGRRVPIGSSGNGGANKGHSSSNAETLNTLFVFLQISSMILTLLNT